MRIPKIILFFTLLFAFHFSQAAPGDTTFVQTFTFGSSQNAWFNFPSDTLQCSKVLMFYTLRCTPTNNPPCGEWDYLTYTYLYRHSGRFDSTVTAIDTVLNDTTWNVFEITERFELGRYITPYGFGLNLGQEGWTWVYDVSDFRTMLKDSVHLSAGNWQEQLDLKFVMIEGTPPRDVKKIVNVYSGGHAYNSTIETAFLTPRKILIDTGVVEAKLRITNTGHGFGDTLTNCSEFCPRNNTVEVNGNPAFTQYLWRDNCGMNPLFPQGGTWLYDRANWCPGAEVYTDEYELTPFIIPGDSIEIDYNMQPGFVWTGQGSQPYYVIESQLVMYGPFNYSNNASLEEIVAPNNTNLTRRYNPICDNPIIRIKNNGAAALTSLQINYGPSGTTPAIFNWTGNLPFGESDTVFLPPFLQSTLWTSNPSFVVSLLNPNGAVDQNQIDDQMRSFFTAPDMQDSSLYLGCLSNNQAWENWYRLEDAIGNVLYHRDSFPNNTYWADTFSLGIGCYKFIVGDTAKDGISFFANNTSGWIKLFNRNGTVAKSFNPGFGTKFEYQFYVTVGTESEKNIAHQNFDVFPNPVQDRFWIRPEGEISGDAVLSVLNIQGKVLRQRTEKFGQGNVVEFDCSDLAKGVYFVKIAGDGFKQVVKVIKM